MVAPCFRSSPRRCDHRMQPAGGRLPVLARRAARLVFFRARYRRWDVWPVDHMVSPSTTHLVRRGWHSPKLRGPARIALAPACLSHIAPALHQPYLGIGRARDAGLIPFDGASTSAAVIVCRQPPPHAPPPSPPADYRQRSPSPIAPFAKLCRRPTRTRDMHAPAPPAAPRWPYKSAILTPAQTNGYPAKLLTADDLADVGSQGTVPLASNTATTTLTSP